ncbi:MAG: gliding motility-associated C-terminal domain-containing protein [Bacteroidetes bacterium]|nr:gliding motility-associated C-terminal domain-containing protein [Bacteroidota bacterium]
MLLSCGKYKLVTLLLLLSFGVFAQDKLTEPWSYSVHYTFGRGTVNPGPPMTGATTSFSYTTNACPLPGEYAISNKIDCPGMPVPKMKTGGYEIGSTFYYGPFAQEGTQPPGYMMLVSYHPSTAVRTLFQTTATGLCSSRDYLFWAPVRNLTNSSCFYPNYTFSVETTGGAVIASFQTGDLGAPGNPTNQNWYYGWYDLIHGPPVNFYGGTFTLPPGVNDVVLKILVNPAPAGVYPDCTAGIAIDNIMLTPMGPNIDISVPGDESAYKTSTCYLGNVPLVLTSSIENNYLKFATPDSVPAVLNNPAVQWQQSLDQGATWTDIPGETSPNISHVFNFSDTFYVRMRAAEAADINKLGCNLTSNVIKIEVDRPTDKFTVGSNSPVCRDSDIVFHLDGGATYEVSGPNGFYVESPVPHIYHPELADSGMYYIKIKTLGGCITEDSTYVVIRGPDLQVGPGGSICYGKSTQLEASGGVSYDWSPAAGLSDTKSSAPYASPVKTTKYQVFARDTSGCGAYASVSVSLRDSLLRAAFSAPSVACPDDVVSYADSSKGAIEQWAWDFGNGITSAEQQAPSQVYAPQHDYAVQLIVRDTADCTDTVLHIVKAVGNCHIAVPSAFSPNNDGANDYLYPLNAWKATDLTFKIYNRNGALVYETKEWTKKWDGRVNGQAQPGGTYVWILDYVDEEGKRHTAHGTTVLVR